MALKSVMQHQFSMITKAEVLRFNLSTSNLEFM